MERSDILRCKLVDFPYRGLPAEGLRNDVHGLTAAVRFHDGITGMFAFAAGINKLMKALNIVRQLLIE
ncbi:MAG TPA: hypothetical protein VLG39_03950 [Nitrospirota bacterium]|nr:hypothetical protein [Nitrospirota bacterium]